MGKDFKLKMAKQLGEKVAMDGGFTELPVDPFQIAANHEIVVQAKPDTAAGVSGMLVRCGDTFGILYATHIDSEGFQRFSVAHELGHYFLEGHPEHVLKDGMHESRAGFVTGDPFELEADHFAAGLLMPKKAFSREIGRNHDGLFGLKALADRCKTSLTSTALRYADLTDCPAAVVVSTGQIIDYCFMSGALRNLDGLAWIKKGTPLPNSCETRRFNASLGNVRNGLDAEDETNLADWFGGRRSVKGLEEVVGLGSYGKTLTVLTFNTLPDDEDEEAEEDLERSWTPRFR